MSHYKRFFKPSLIEKHEDEFTILSLAENENSFDVILIDKVLNEKEVECFSKLESAKKYYDLTLGGK